MDRSTSNDPAASAGQPFKGGLVHALAGGLGYRLVLFLLVAWWVSQFPVRSPKEGNYYYHSVGRIDSLLGDLCVKWDSYWYLNVVANGYVVNRDVQENNTAFLPAYPLLIKTLTSLGIDPAMAGVMLSVIFMIVALIFAYLYAADQFSLTVAAALVMYLSVFPSSWVMNMVYTESLFCAAIFGFLWLYHRGHFGWSVLPALLLPWTRAIGMTILPAIALDAALCWWREKRFPKDRALPLAAAAAGLISVCVYYAFTTGHPLEFLTQSKQWSTQDIVSDSAVPLVGSLLKNMSDPAAQSYLPFLILYGVVAVASVIQKRNISTLFAAFYIVMLLGVSHWAQLRYLLPLLPIHASIVCFADKRGWTMYLLPALAVIQIVVTRFYLDWMLVI